MVKRRFREIRAWCALVISSPVSLRSRWKLCLLSISWYTSLATPLLWYRCRGINCTEVKATFCFTPIHHGVCFEGEGSPAMVNQGWGKCLWVKFQMYGDRTRSCPRGSSKCKSTWQAHNLMDKNFQRPVTVDGGVRRKIVWRSNSYCLCRLWGNGR